MYEQDMQSIKAVIFDNDGILTFRPPSINEETVELLRSRGWEGDAEKFKELWRKSRNPAFRGEETFEDSLERFFKIAGISADKELRDKALALRAKSGQSKQLYPEVKSALGTLKEAGLVLAILTDTTQTSEECRAWFAGQGVEFDAIFSSADMGYTKHNKQIFQTALKRLGFGPKEVVFVGHSPHEIGTSKRAGIFTVSKDPEVKGDVNISSLAELPELLERLKTNI
jgi:putative hydrolase of the HAD superfamily